MLDLALEIRKKCSLMSICKRIVNNELGELYYNDATLSEKLGNLSTDSVSALMPLLVEMIA